MFNLLSGGVGSALGGLFGAAGSVAGAEISAQEQAQANAANIAQSQWMAQGKYIPGLISSANAAGINPLVAMGVHSPGFATSISSGSGSGASGAGAAIGAAFNQMAHEDRLQRGREELQSEEILNARKTREQMTTAIDSQKIVSDTNRWLLEQMRSTGSASGSAVDQLLRGVWNRPGLNWGLPGGSGLSPSSMWGPAYKGQTGMFGGIFDPSGTYGGR